MTTRQQIRDYITEDEEWCSHDEDIACMCDYCGDPIYRNDNALGFITPDNRTFMLCDNCTKNTFNRMSAYELLDMAGIYCTEGDVEKVEKRVTTVWARFRNGQRKV